MGLSVVIAGSIMMLALMFVIFSIPTFLDSVTSVGETSTQVSNLENTILQTEISLDGMVVNSSMPSFTFNLNNINTEKLWDYENFDVLVTYDADVSGKKTSITDSIPFNLVNKSYTILDEQASIVANTAPATYAAAPNPLLTTTENVEGFDSHILFHANVTFEDSAGSDCSGRVALFIDGAMVAEAEDSSDDNAPEEPGNIGITWWETGLDPAVTHDFEVRWLDQQANCIIETGTEYSMQVIEFTPGDGVPTILTEVTSLSAESYPTFFQSIDGLTGTPTIEGPDSLVITTGTVTFDEDGGGDASCYLGIFIDGVRQAEQQTFTDSNILGSSAGIMWAETGLSAGSHTIDLQAHEDQTGCGTDTALQRHMQVVEYTSGNPTILAEETSNALQDMTGAYAIITGLEPAAPLTIDGPGSLVLFTATVTFDRINVGEADLGLFIDGTMVAEGRTYVENTNNEPGHVNLHWWGNGLSAGDHDFDVRGKEGTGDTETDTQTQSHMQVVEFPCIKQWNILSITDDAIDPGVINPEETAKISIELCNPIFSNGNVVVSVSTDNGSNAIIGGIAT